MGTRRKGNTGLKCRKNLKESQITNTIYYRVLQILQMSGDFSSEFDGETARLSIQHVYPEDEGEYTCVAYNDLGKAFTSACLIVDGNSIS